MRFLLDVVIGCFAAQACLVYAMCMAMESGKQTSESKA